MYGTCLACFVVLLVPRFDQNQFRPLRAFLFIFAGLLSAVPAFHAKRLESKYLVAFNVWYWFIGGVLYITGAVTYASKIPERFYPKKFDIIVSFTLV